MYLPGFSLSYGINSLYLKFISHPGNLSMAKERNSPQGRKRTDKGGMTSKLSVPWTWPCSCGLCSAEPGKEPVRIDTLCTSKCINFDAQLPAPLSHPIFLVPYLPGGPEGCQVCMCWSSLGRRGWGVSVCPGAISGPSHVHHEGWLFAQP